MVPTATANPPLSSPPPPEATATPEDVLDPAAAFGKLPFDKFVLTHWDFDQPVEGDQAQWDALAQKYLDLDPRERYPLDHDKPFTPAQMQRVLGPHQTIQERNLTLHLYGRTTPVWLRTCYAPPELAAEYASWQYNHDKLEDDLGGALYILDDEALYAPFEDDWSRVLLRCPAIAPPVVDDYDSDAEDEDFPGEGDEDRIPLYKAWKREKGFIFVVDEEAVRSGWVRVVWLDCHGEAVWENFLHHTRIMWMKGRMVDGGSLRDIMVDYIGDSYFYQVGAEL